MAVAAAVILWLQLGPASTGAPAAPIPAGPPRPRVVQLPNGFRIVVCELPRSTLAHVGVFQSVGPPEEPTGKEGIAHLLEHLMFTSSRNHPDGGLQAALALQACYANASTNPVATEYRTICIPELLPDILRLEADRVRALDPSVDELEREKSIVREELAYRG